MRHPILLLAALLSTTACQVDQPPADNNLVTSDSPEKAGPGSATNTFPEAPPPPTPAPTPTPAQPSDPSVPPPPHMDPDAPPPPAENTALGAARRLQEYCDAVATKRYRDAYALWGDGGKATGMSFEAFRDSFAKYRAYDCHIGDPGRVEGAAGSMYVTIPLQVTGALSKGGGFHLAGPVTMRRVNDVPGSTAEQRRWHIQSSGLKPRP